MNLNNKKTHHYYDQITLEVVNPIPTQSVKYLIVPL